MKKSLTLQDELTEFLLYTSPNGEIKVEAFLQNETLWLPQKRMAELFGVTPQNINIHLKNIFETGELEELSTCKELLQVQQEGARKVERMTKFYNLDAILSVGYRVNSRQATQFRIWASKILKEYIIKGFAMDDERLKNGKYFGKDYFGELLERVRSIRTSERRMYLQITDIFSECAIDYDKNSETARNFFATVQNKFHYAITGKTAAEIIDSSADHTKEKMGLTSFKNSPDGRVLKSDVTIAKNYLEEPQIKKLERTIASYFDYIENQIEKRNEFTMESLALSVNKFLEFNDFKVLEGNGKIAKAQADKKAENEYDIFNTTQKIDSDFEKFLQSKK
jgi:hypothetical protein